MSAVSKLIPRLDCLGLIEADLDDLDRCTEDGIPRLDCLGLIEAHVAHSCKLSARWIPRLDCLGLIEAHGVRKTLVNSAGRFRGLIASASLKRTPLLAVCEALFMIPRLDCLGLIEAYTTSRRLRGAVHDSEA